MALKRKDKHFKFLENQISLNRNCGLFVTLNPEYAGRTAMMVPDFELIAEILFLSDGILDLNFNILGF